MACKGVPDVVKVKISVVSPVPSCSPKRSVLPSWPVRDQALNDAQDVATGVLYAEAKLEELLNDRPEVDRGSRGGTSKPLPDGISKKQSHYAQTLADNIDTIEEVILEAHENEESPRNGGRSQERKMSDFSEKLLSIRMQEVSISFQKYGEKLYRSHF